jgi:hypothetical protein
MLHRCLHTPSRDTSRGLSVASLRPGTCVASVAATELGRSHDAEQQPFPAFGPSPRGIHLGVPDLTRVIGGFVADERESARPERDPVPGMQAGGLSWRSVDQNGTFECVDDVLIFLIPPDLRMPGHQTGDQQIGIRAAPDYGHGIPESEWRVVGLPREQDPPVN